MEFSIYFFRFDANTNEVIYEIYYVNSILKRIYGLKFKQRKE